MKEWSEERISGSWYGSLFYTDKKCHWIPEFRPIHGRHVGGHYWEIVGIPMRRTLDLVVSGFNVGMLWAGLGCTEFLRSRLKFVSHD